MAAIVMYTRVTAIEAKRNGIRVNAVTPFAGQISPTTAALAMPPPSRRTDPNGSAAPPGGEHRHARHDRPTTVEVWVQPPNSPTP
jgi:NAD(P)-dependent dehydrogenase (short-subunit alcohol dehydrogenase family)